MTTTMPLTDPDVIVLWMLNYLERLSGTSKTSQEDSLLKQIFVEPYRMGNSTMLCAEICYLDSGMRGKMRSRKKLP